MLCQKLGRKAQNVKEKKRLKEYHPVDALPASASYWTNSHFVQWPVPSV